MNVPDAVVIGYGQLGPLLTERLLADGRSVRVVTRSGSGPAQADRVAADLLDPTATARAIGDAPLVLLCAHAPYSAKVWADRLPRMEASVTSHAATTGAVVVTAESLYAWDGTTGPISTDVPFQPRSRKGQVRQHLMEERSRSGARVVSVVSGDFYGPGVLTSHAGDRLLEPILTGKPARPVGDVDAPLAFTVTPDLTRASLRAADLPGEGHELVMAPNAGSVSMRELATITAAAADRPVPQLKPYSIPMLRMVGLFSSMVREITDVAHQFTRPFEVETAASEVRLGMSATPWAQAAAETVAWWRSR